MAETPTWPPTIKGPIPKPSASARKAKARKDRRELVTSERDAKGEARQRDRNRCRFPLCGCRKQNLALHGAHWFRHKGMGGDPTGQRSLPHLIITVCVARHRESALSIDKGTIEVRPLSKKAGANGLVEWWMDRTAYEGQTGPAQWLRLAREERIGGPYTDLSLQASEVLYGLARLER